MAIIIKKRHVGEVRPAAPLVEPPILLEAAPLPPTALPASAMVPWQGLVCSRCGIGTPQPCNDNWKERDCVRGFEWNRNRWKNGERA